MRKLICLHDENTRIQEEKSSSSSNTRALAEVKGKHVKLDWFQGTFSRNCHDELRRTLLRYFPDPHVKTDAKPVMSYHMAERWSHGILISTTADYARSHVSLSATALGWLDITEQRLLLRELDLLGIKPTRIDLALDDYDRELSLEWHSNQISLENTLCYFRSAKVVRNLMTAEDETVYLGRRGSSGSGLFFRIYDKNIESKGEVNAIRYEAEFTSGKAATVFGILLECAVTDEESYEDTIAGLVLGCLDYRRKRSKNSLNKCSRVPEWEAFLQQRLTYRVVKPKSAPVCGFNTEHFVKQYGTSLIVLELLDPTNLSDVLYQCRERARARGIRNVGGRLIGTLPDWVVNSGSK